MVADNPMVEAPRSTGWAIRLDTVAPQPAHRRHQEEHPGDQHQPGRQHGGVMKSGAASDVAAISTAADDDVADTNGKRLLPTSPYTASPASSAHDAGLWRHPAMAA